MGYRHLFCTSQISQMDHDNIWNHPYADPRLNLENGSFVLPAEDVAHSSMNSMAYSNVTLRTNGPSSSNFSSEIPNYGPSNSVASHDPYMHLSSLGNANRIPPNYIQSGPFCYNQLTIGDASSAVNAQVDYGRVPFKRKNPAISMAFDRGSTNRYYSAGSSSDLSISSANSQPNPMPVPQYHPWDPISMAPTYNNLSASGERSQRNVRSRHNHSFHLENNPTGACTSSNLSHHLHPTAGISGLTSAGQWSHTRVYSDSHRRPLSSEIADAGFFNHEMNQFLTGSSSTSSSMEIDGQHHPSLVQSRSSRISQPTLHGFSSQIMGAGCSSHGQRTTPCQPISSYPPLGFSATMEDGRRLGMEAVPPSRQSRPLSIIGRSTERNGRSSNLYDRLHPFPDEENSHSRWVSESVNMMDRSTYYDSRNLFDQHRDMRLDIDNMSYEELLALEERIGNVSTGLSEDAISRCLMGTIHYSYDQMQDDDEKGSCVICLEEYKDREGLGRLRCGHDFHAGCIKKWLLIKNVCPICKASALPDA